MKLGTCLASIAALTAVIVSPTGSAQQSASSIPSGDWQTIHRDLAATRYSPLDQINSRNVEKLSSAWTYTLVGNSTAVPIVIDGTMYLPNRDRIVALDPATGEELWAHLLDLPAAESVGPGGRGGPTASTRGVSYWAGNEDQAPRILFTARNFIVALDAATGKAVDSFGTGGHIDVGVPFGGTPTIFRNVAIIGAASGEVPQGPPGNPRAYDVVTGQKLWEFWTVPRAGEPFNETWGDGWEGRGGTNMWGFNASVDTTRGLAYLPIAGPAPNYYGGDRPGANLFGNSIVAVEVESGEYVWHFQTVHHDIWDIDMAFAGGLFDVVRGGQRYPAIANVGKSSYLFVLNRVDGKPLIPVEERSVPAGDVPGEWYSPTQPFPVAPPPLSRVSFNPETDLVTADDTSTAHVAACRAFMDRSGGFYNAGPFTPFRYKAADAPARSTIQFPGGTGGVNWGGPAVDPTTGIVYANAQDTSLIGWVQDKDPDVTYSFEAVGSKQLFDRASVNGVGPFFSFAAPLSGEYDENGRAIGPNLPCQRPPWSRLVAVNANTGDVLWQTPLGLNENLPPGKQLTGNSGSAGPTVTAGGLVFVGATRDRRFRAFDAANGAELWVASLETNANANPMTYLDTANRQHVAIVAGDRVEAFRLP
jgi:glucose dehydrogenase